MSLTLEERTQNITQVLTVMCDNDAVAKCCSNVSINGLSFATLLGLVQTEYPVDGWDADKLDVTVVYMRKRGIVLFQNGSYALNFYMLKLGGVNLEFAKLCPKVQQPYGCNFAQVGKYATCSQLPTMVESTCHVSDPYTGCCPPLTVSTLPPPQ